MAYNTSHSHFYVYNMTEIDIRTYHTSHAYLDWVSTCYRCGKSCDMYTSSHICGPPLDRWIRHQEYKLFEHKRQAGKNLYKLAKQGK
jgi:hypothetical protein